MGPSRDIKVISGMLFLYPLFFFIEYLVLSPRDFKFETNSAFSIILIFIFYEILGYGIWRLNWKIRLAAIIWSTIEIIGPILGILGMFVVSFTADELFIKVLNRYGAYDIIWYPVFLVLTVFGPSMVYFCFIVYKLTRPEVKKQFIRQ